MTMVDAALKIMHEMASFADAVFPVPFRLG